jgi:predicted nucleic acid-binding protein
VILLDTNVLSALMRRAPDPAVITWLDSQAAESIWTTTITTFEILFGIGILTDGRKKRDLSAAFIKAMDEDLEGRLLPFDHAAAQAAAGIAAEGRRRGRPVEIRDVQIAGIAQARNATLATRNTRHFTGFGIRLIDPWQT